MKGKIIETMRECMSAKG